MRALLGIVLLASATVLWAQDHGSSVVEMIDRSEGFDFSSGLERHEDGWMAFSVPAIEGTKSYCCWNGYGSDYRKSGCNLDSRKSSYGYHSDSSITENLVIFSRFEQGQVTDMRVVGEQCPVYGSSIRVDWLGHHDDSDALNWLSARTDAGEPEHVQSTALMAVAQHESTEATGILNDMARDRDSDLRQEAVFWLGESRGEQGLDHLETLLGDLPDSDLRREINFAISQSGSPRAADLLVAISENDRDPEQRSNALFWLAQSYPERAEQVLRSAVMHVDDEDSAEPIVFAISQLPEDVGGPMLLQIATDPTAPRAVRRQALFWLSQSDDPETLNELTRLLSQSD